MKKILIFTYLLAGYELKAQWNSWQIKGLGGIHGTFTSLDPNEGPRFGCISGWSIEKGYITSNRIYIGGEFSFPYYDEIFIKEKITHGDGFRELSERLGFGSTFDKRLYLIWPVVMVNLGYKFENGHLFTLGSVYHYAASASYRVPISDKVSFELRGGS